jgi:hypothetical protein
VFGLLLLQKKVSWAVRFGAPALCVAAAAVLFLPWDRYTATVYPEAYAYMRSLAKEHFVEPVAGHGGPWYFYFDRLGKLFGHATWVPLAGFFGWAFYRKREWLPLLAWFALVYGVFSLAATKMAAYVLIASPVIWCALGWFCSGAFLPAQPLGRWRRIAGIAVAVWVCGTYAVTAGIEELGLQNPKPRSPAWARELRYVASEVRGLPKGKWIVFNVFAPVEAMFYSGVTCVSEPVTPAWAAYARRQGFRVAAYRVGLPGRHEVTQIDRCASTVSLQDLTSILRAGKLLPARIYVGRGRHEVQEYLERNDLDVRVDVWKPRERRRLADRLKDKRKVVMLVGNPSPALQAFLNESPGVSTIICRPFAVQSADLAPKE